MPKKKRKLKSSCQASKTAQNKIDTTKRTVKQKSVPDKNTKILKTNKRTALIYNLKRFINTEDKKRLLSNFMSLSTLQLLIQVLPLLTLPYLVRVLGMEKYGLVMFAQSFTMYFVMLVDYGFNLSATREISIYRDDKNKLTEIYSSVMMIKIILIIFSFIVMSAVVLFIESFNQDWNLYLHNFGFVIGQAIFPVWYFQGIEQMKYITIVNIIAKIVFTILIFILINTPDDYLFVPLLNALGMGIAALVSLYIIHKHFLQGFTLQKISILTKYFKSSTQFFLSRVSVSIYTASNLLVLGLFTSNIMVGHYSIAETLYKGLQSIYSPIATTLYPYVAKQKNIAIFKKIFKTAFIANILLIIILLIISPILFNILFENFHSNDSIKIFNILLIAALIVVPSIMLGYPFLAALDHSKEANLSVIIGSIAHLIGLGLLTLLNQLTIYTVAYMVVITESIVLFFRLYWIKKYKLWQNV